MKQAKTHGLPALLRLSAAAFLLLAAACVTDESPPDYEPPLLNAIELSIGLVAADFVDGKVMYDLGSEESLELSYALLRVGVSRFDGDGPHGPITAVSARAVEFDLIRDSVTPSTPRIELPVGSYRQATASLLLRSDDAPTIEIHGNLRGTEFVFETHKQQEFLTPPINFYLDSGRDAQVSFGIDAGTWLGQLDLNLAEREDDGTVFLTDERNTDLQEEAEDDVDEQVDSDFEGEKEDENDDDDDDE